MRNHIREWREAAGLTQVQLGERVGVTGAQISRLETGSRNWRIPTIEGIAATLGLGDSRMLLFPVPRERRWPARPVLPLPMLRPLEKPLVWQMRIGLRCP